MFYISKYIDIEHHRMLEFPNDPDILAVKLKNTNFNINIINIYNQKNQKPENNLTTIMRHRLAMKIPSNTIIVGDFNEHHPNWDPYYPRSSGAESLLDWMEEQCLSVSNIVGQGTFFRPHMALPSVIDLTLVTSWSGKYLQDWQTIPTGSDHHGIIFTIMNQKYGKHQSVASPVQFNTKKADWVKFQKACIQHFKVSSALNPANLQILSQKTTQDLWHQGNELKDNLDRIGLELTNILIQAAEVSISRKHTGAKSKPWWTEKLKMLRKEMMRAFRVYLKDNSNQGKWKDYKNARNKYFQEIKIAKKNHWNTFLEQEDPSSIFKALRYTRGNQNAPLPSIQDKDGNVSYNFEAKCFTLRSQLFETPPRAPELDWSSHKESTWDWPELTSLEVESVEYNQSSVITVHSNHANIHCIIKSRKLTGLHLY